MRNRTTLTIAALALAAIGLPAPAWAQKVDVQTETAKDANFTGLCTYKWLPPPPAPPSLVAPGLPTGRRTIEQIDPVIHAAVDRELQAKGYRMVESGESDLLVGYLVNMSPDTNTFSMADEYAAVTGTTIYFGPGATSRTASLSYTDMGTLAVGVVSAANKQVLWRGVAKSKIALATPYPKVDKAVTDGVQKMFRKFPKQSAR